MSQQKQVLRIPKCRDDAYTLKNAKLYKNESLHHVNENYIILSQQKQVLSIPKCQDEAYACYHAVTLVKGNHISQLIIAKKGIICDTILVSILQSP